MVFTKSLISLVIILTFIFYVRSTPDDFLAGSMFAVLLIAFPFLAFGLILSFNASTIWLKKIRKKEYSRFHQKLSILPALPMIFCWGYILVNMMWFLLVKV